MGRGDGWGRHARETGGLVSQRNSNFGSSCVTLAMRDSRRLSEPQFLPLDTWATEAYIPGLCAELGLICHFLTLSLVKSPAWGPGPASAATALQAVLSPWLSQAVLLITETNATCVPLKGSLMLKLPNDTRPPPQLVKLLWRRQSQDPHK